MVHAPPQERTSDVFFQRFCACIPHSGTVAPLRHDSDTYSPSFRALESAQTRALNYARNALGLPSYHAIGMAARMGAELARWTREDGQDREALRLRLAEAAEHGMQRVMAPHWNRLGLLVDALMHPHPLLRDLPSAPTVVYDEAGISASCDGMNAVLSEPEWYIPVNEESARTVALKLALQLREQYDGEA